MKTVILAGGLGTRLSEETTLVPKPMVRIGEEPIIWHIMSRYAHYGYSEFCLALGYRGDVVKRFFIDRFSMSNHVKVDLGSGKVTIDEGRQPDWKVDLIDTGLGTQTAGRLKRVAPWLGGERFMVTYGDGVADIDIAELVDFHKSHGKLATITAVHPPARFGHMTMEANQVVEFTEKSQTDEGRINGGFFVFEPEALDYMYGDDHMLERKPLEQLALDGELMAYFHDGFWHPMDTVRDKQILEKMWSEGKAPWKVES